MGLLLKRTSKGKQSFKANSRVVTKSYDLGDPSLTKKFSQCHITYKVDGNGTAPILVRYRIDNDITWTAFRSDTKNNYSTGSALKKTNGKAKTASFKFKKGAKGLKVAIKIQHGNTASEAEGFEIVDISFTFRGINRG
jgi:hypothetical protein